MRKAKKENSVVKAGWREEKKTEQDVVQRGFRERGVEEGMREDEGGERGQTVGGS